MNFGFFALNILIASNFSILSKTFYPVWVIFGIWPILNVAVNEFVKRWDNAEVVTDGNATPSKYGVTI